jgi:hypothetical protein
MGNLFEAFALSDSAIFHLKKKWKRKMFRFLKGNYNVSSRRKVFFFSSCGLWFISYFVTKIQLSKLFKIECSISGFLCIKNIFILIVYTFNFQNTFSIKYFSALFFGFSSSFQWLPNPADVCCFASIFNQSSFDSEHEDFTALLYKCKNSFMKFLYWPFSSIIH